MSATVLKILDHSFGEEESNNNNSEKKLRFPYDIVKVDDETNAKLLQDFTGEKSYFVQVGPKKWFFPSGYVREADNYYNFQPRPDDVWVVTYPRSGTTWTQEMIWLISNNLDYETAEQMPLIARFPFFEFSSFVHSETKKEFLMENSHSPENLELVHDISAPAWKLLKATKQRRFIKTHLPFSLLPPSLLQTGCKVIYIARNPKDVAVSFYHLNRLIRTQGYVGDFPKYWDYFERNLQPWAPYWEHITEAWKLKHEKNLLFIFYEDMIKENLRPAIEKVADFLGHRYSKEDLNKLEDHLQIDNFRKNKSVNFDVYKQLGILKSGEQEFIRKGKTGGWTDYFNDDLNARADEWIDLNLQTTDLRFPIIK